MKTKITLLIPKIQTMMTGVYAVDRIGNKFTITYTDGTKESAVIKDVPPWVEGEELPEDFNLFSLVGKIQSKREKAI